MTPERWSRVADIYDSALEQTPAERADYVARACGNDVALRREVESLLAQEQTPVVVDRPVGAAAASVLGMAPHLTAGSLVGPYRVRGLLGEGGMGQVYRAHDTKLQRDVALKILPDAFVHDADRVARFTREAQVLASLNHPNIAAIHGFEDSGPVHALVLELVEGPTLADRIARGPLPLDEALPIARQIAEALEAAHEYGIVHRDLKPANIKLREDGTVKVLDFGLAKPAAPAGAADLPGRWSHSPTVMSPAVSTAGVILGTAAYMSPEQAKGKPIDKRSDVWAFGCVLYEMLTGQRAFDGEDVSETIAAVLKSDVDWSRLPPDVPASIRALMRGCLTKDRKLRIGDIAAALFVLRSPALLESGRPATSVTPTAKRRRAAALIAVALALIAGTSIGTWYATRPAPQLPLSSVVEATPFFPGLTRRFVVTPDGSTIVYVGTTPSRREALYTKRMDQFATPVLLVENASWPFLDPAGDWVGYLDRDAQALKKIPLRGGPPQELATLGEVSGAFRGAAWGGDGSIVYAVAGEATGRPASSGLWRLAPNGRTPERIVTPDRAKGEGDYFVPHFLPDGHAVLVAIAAPIIAGAPSPLGASIGVVDLRAPRPSPTIVVSGGTDPHYVAGHLVYVAGNALRAVRFDNGTLKTFGTSVDVWTREGDRSPAWVGNFAVTGHGTLVFTNTGGATGLRTMVWVDRSGNEEGLSPAPPPMAYRFPRLSNDLARVALDVGGFVDREIWTWHLGAGAAVKISDDPAARDRGPAWTSDDAYLVFGSYRGGRNGLFIQRSDGTGNAHRLTTDDIAQIPLSVRGTTIAVVRALGPPTGADIVTVQLPSEFPPPTGETTLPLTDLLRTPAGEWNPAISPDGRWLAYNSDDSGKWLTYVSPYPDPTSGPREPVAEGAMPLWSRSGNELFYISPTGQVMSVPLRPGGSWREVVGAPTPLFDGQSYDLGGAVNREAQRPFPMYDYDHRRQRFLMIKPIATQTGPDPDDGKVFLQQGWVEQMKRLVANAP